VAQQRNSVLVLLVVEVSTSQLDTYTHTLGKTPLNSEQPVAVAATCTIRTTDEH